MTNAPLPDSSELTKENFIHSGWKEILGDSPMDHYQRAHHKFSTAISKAQEDGDLPRAKIFLLLAAACSMHLTNKSPSEPFAPLATGYGILPLSQPDGKGSRPQPTPNQPHQLPETSIPH